ncbi:MAG TPA: hypothetical protein VK811_01075, partial [Candidatus Acidoferrum sp.]|nr:hypothetical protein [Candidatus Acidoferrum sp.]
MIAIIMKKLLPIVLTMAMAVWFLCQMQPPKDTDFAFSQFGKLPVVFNGRLKPMDSLARNSLLQIHETQTLDLEPWASDWQKHPTIPAIQWLANVMMNPQVADDWPVFRVDNPDLIAFLKLPERNLAQHQDGEHYSWNQIAPALDALDKEDERVEKIESAERDAYEHAVVKIHDRLELYAQLRNTVQPQDTQNWKQELSDYEGLIPSGVAAVRSQQNGKTYNQQVFNAFLAELQRFDYMAQLEPPLIVPPDADSNDWQNVGTILLQAAKGNPVPSTLENYAALASALQSHDVAGFNSALVDLQASFVPRFDQSMARARAEVFFNQMQPFYNAMVIYVLAGLLAIFSWFNLSEGLRRSAVWLVALAFLIHTTGLIYRIVLQDRP